MSDFLLFQCGVNSVSQSRSCIASLKKKPNIYILFFLGKYQHLNMSSTADILSESESPLPNTQVEVVIPQSMTIPIPLGECTELAAVVERYVRDQGKYLSLF